jgi:hypothetical protein
MAARPSVTASTVIRRVPKVDAMLGATGYRFRKRQDDQLMVG